MILATSVARRFAAGIIAVSAVAIGAAAPAATAAPPEMAQRSRTTSATIGFEPAGSVLVGTRYDVVASGFRPYTWVTVGASYDTVYWYSGVTDGSGELRLTLDARAVGQIRHEAWEQRRSGMRLKATAVLTVVAAA